MKLVTESKNKRCWVTAAKLSTLTVELRVQGRRVAVELDVTGAPAFDRVLVAGQVEAAWARALAGEGHPMYPGCIVTLCGKVTEGAEESLELFSAVVRRLELVA